MRILADECLYFNTTTFLRGHGYDVLTVQEAGLSGSINGQILEFASKERRILLTRDSHFCNILKFPPKDHNGVIVIKINPTIVSGVHSVLLNFLRNYSQNQIERTLVVIDQKKFRIRR